LLRQLGIDPENVPRHVAIIMDGNGRWAEKRGLARIRGHREAVKAVRSTLKACNELGIKYLTLFAFSVDNWKRPKEEVDALMDLLRDFLKKERKTLIDNKIRFKTIGDIKALPDPVQVEIEKTLKATRGFTEHHIVMAANYGGRADILHGVRECARKCAGGEVDPDTITEEFFSSCLYTDGIPDPDLLIRTSGEYRMSNFLLWQISYTEVWVTPVLWPDFRKDDLIEAVIDYSKRERRFGGR
jgi:undecaprenyl diphosphate synthase